MYATLHNAPHTTEILTATLACQASEACGRGFGREAATGLGHGMDVGLGLGTCWSSANGSMKRLDQAAIPNTGAPSP
jgi:hypothetical protein